MRISKQSLGRGMRITWEREGGRERERDIYIYICVYVYMDIQGYPRIHGDI